MRRRIISNVASAVIGLAIFALALPTSLGGRTGYIVVSGHSMDPTMHTGDLAVVRKQSSYRKGDIVAFVVPKDQVGAGQVVIHRIERVTPRGFIMLGDNNRTIDPWVPKESDLVGRRVLLVPRFQLALKFLGSPLALGVLAGAFAAVLVYSRPGSSRNGEDDRNETTPAPLSEHADPPRPRGRRRTHIRRPARARRRPSQSLVAAGITALDTDRDDGCSALVPGGVHASGARVGAPRPRDGGDSGGELGVGLPSGAEDRGLRRVHRPLARTGAGRHSAVE